jgi:predicted dehydrogenase
MTNESKTIKYCCIGAGGIASKKHLPGYAAEPRCNVAAICDSDLSAARKLASAYSVERIYSDPIEMLEREKPDIVSVCTPNFTHMELAVAALERGCNVHVEKPVALNYKQARRICDEAEKRGLQVMLGLNKRYMGQTFLLQRLVNEGFFGDIYKASCGWERSSGIPGTGRWFTDKALSGGGALIDLGVHYLDLALSLMGYPKAKSVMGHTYSVFGAGSERIRRGYKSNPDGVYNVEDMANGTVNLENGATLNFVFSWASNIEREVRYVELVGTKGGMRMENDSIRLFTQLGGTMFTLTPDEATMPEGVNECSHFVSSLLAGQPVLTPATQGAELMRIIDGLYLSAETGDRVLISDMEDRQ